MLIIDTPRAIKKYLGKELGVSAWVEIDQDRIDRFAAATGDDQWIHVDVERARRELPTHTTIAHGYLVLSMIPLLRRDIFDIAKKSRSINYGLNKVRFLEMVPTGARLRLRQICRQIEDTEPAGVRVLYENIIELEGSRRPACIAETIAIHYE